ANGVIDLCLKRGKRLKDSPLDRRSAIYGAFGGRMQGNTAIEKRALEKIIVHLDAAEPINFPYDKRLHGPFLVSAIVKKLQELGSVCELCTLATFLKDLGYLKLLFRRIPKTVISLEVERHSLYLFI